MGKLSIPTHDLPIRGILFDVPDVLYDATLWRRWLLKLIARFGVTACYDEFFATWDRDFLVDVHSGRRDFQEALESFLLHCGLSWAQIDEVEAAGRVYWQSAEQNVRPLPGVTSTLASLASSGVVLAAWADMPFSSLALGHCLERLGLRRHFTVVLTSLEVSASQPDPRSYQAALEAMALTPQDVLYVGHDRNHLAGASKLSLRAAAFNFQLGAEADIHLSKFEEIIGYVAENGSNSAAQIAMSGAHGSAVSKPWQLQRARG